MPAIRISNFMGTLPRVNARLLPDTHAQVARNTRLEDGTLSPVRIPTTAHTFGSDVTSIYLDGLTWRGWTSVVDVAPAPVAANRLYYTGDGAPKMMDSGTVYDLALAAPVDAPTLTALSTPDPDTSEATFYVYTYVTGFGEESPPSPLSDELATDGVVVVRLSGFSTAPAGRNITHMRVYRSQTTLSGATELYFVDEIPVATATYDHDPVANPIVEPIPSKDYDPPPAGLTGLTAMANGMMAAFVGKIVYFCEPYQPHAWPEKYTLAVDADIVGLAAFGSNLAILTDNAPHLAQGTHPSTMVMERLDKSLPCLSRRGIVDVGYAAYFPSTEGLAMISGSAAEIITRGVFTREQWRDLGPDTFIADQFDGRYLFTYLFEDQDAYDAGDETGTGADTIDGGGVTLSSGLPVYDFGSAFSAFGSQRLGMLDLTGSQPYFMDFDVAVPTAMYRHDPTGDLYLLEGARDVKLWEDRQAARASLRWLSKRFILPYATSFGAVLIETDIESGTGDEITCRIYADGVQVDTITETNTAKRLTSGRLARTWEIEFDGSLPVTAFTIAHSVEELFAG